MMRKLITYLILLTITIFCECSAQNLVLNPSFEDTIQLPTPYGTLIDSFAYNWTRPIGHTGTPDYFHVFSSSSLGGQGFQIPDNLLGYQDTCNENAYSGLTAYSNFTTGSSNWREYITGELLSRLDSNVCYKLTFKYSLGEKWSKFGIANFGIYFSDSIPINNSMGASGDNLNYIPQIEVNQWMNDTENWVSIERFFLAQGDEQFFTLGNFNDNDNTDTILVNNISIPGNPNGFYSYVYLDDIHVEEVPTLSLPQINLGEDTIMCKGEELVYDSLLSNNPIYVWNNLVESSDSSFTIDSSGTYWVEAYNGCSYSTDTIKVEFVEPKVNLGNDTTLCKREELFLSSIQEHSRTEYLWSTGDTSKIILASDTGLYRLNANIGHCEDIDSIYIQYNIPENSKLLSTDQDTTFCVSGILDVGSSAWNDIYLWNTDATTQTLEVTATGVYEVYAENECTEVTSIFNVTVESLEQGLNNYNIITPNNDFVNGLFTIYEGNSEEYQIQIYNRWGKLVFESDDPLNHWDGAYGFRQAQSDNQVSDGSYFYHLSFRNCAGETVEQKGTVEVKR